MELLLSKISHPAFPLTGAGAIKNIIFDYGGVICNIDVKITERCFAEMGFKVNDPDYPTTALKPIIDRLEAGAITPQQFRDALKPFFSVPVTDQQLNDAWNALLLDMPAPRIRLLDEVRKSFRIFMLTNTNEIHYHTYRQRFQDQYGYSDFDGLFEKAYYSYRMGLMKPDPEIFRMLAADRNLRPGETLFIDDTLMHVEGANVAGMHAHHLRVTEGAQIMELFG
ncbi:MAG: HAD family hydrolase [Candidatus Methylumidiphilus sp.]